MQGSKGQVEAIRRSVAQGGGLRPERIDDDLFESTAELQPNGRTFGGRLVAECLAAAAQTVEPAFRVNALHMQFLNPGDTAVPVRFAVERLRDGRNFSSRQVRALQGERLVCTALVSAGRESFGLEQQPAMPDVPAPEDVAPHHVVRDEIKAANPPLANLLFGREHPVEIRPVLYPRSGTERPEAIAYWFRPLPDWEDLTDPIGRAAVVAYMSDRLAMTSSTIPHLKLLDGHDFVLSSLDHALWIHRDYHPGFWLLHWIESVTTTGRRAYVRGRMFTETGDYIASTGQEGLLDPRPRPVPAP